MTRTCPAMQGKKKAIESTRLFIRSFTDEMKQEIDEMMRPFVLMKSMKLLRTTCVCASLYFQCHSAAALRND